MFRILHISMLVGLLGAAPAAAIDYDTIDRSIGKEPVYSGKPEYVLLLLGAEARRRVWIVIDGEAIYIDRNGDGDLTEAEERFATSDDCKQIDISDPAGDKKYVIDRLRVHRDENGKHPPFLLAHVDVGPSPSFQQYCDARLGASPAEAAIAHFDGPLAIGPSTIAWKVPPETVLTTGAKPDDLYAMVGTMSERHKCWVVVISHKSTTECCFPDAVRPRVAVEFPAQASGAPPVIEQYTLDKFC